MVAVFAILAALAYALANVLQRRGAQTVPDADALGMRIVGDLLRRPIWVAGIGTMIVGVALQALALHSGPITVAEPGSGTACRPR